MDLKKRKETLLEMAADRKKRIQEEKERTIKKGQKRDSLKEKMIEYSLQRMEEIEKTVQTIDAIRITFAGRAGVGKSTATGSLFGLTVSKSFKEGLPIEEAYLLQAGSGRTTLCDTRVLFFCKGKTQIYVIPVSEEEVKGKIALLFQKEEENAVEEEALSIEERRYLLQMAGLPFTASHEEICSLLEKSREKEKESLEDIFFRKINYSKAPVFLDSEGRKGEELFSWLKENLLAISSGKSPFMPKEICVLLSTEDTPKEVPFFIKEVRDTRGLDEAERPEILERIHEKDALCIFCDEVKAAGSDPRIHQILQQMFIPGMPKAVKKRILLMGIAHGKQMQQVNGAQGDPEEGSKIKREEALFSMKRAKISFEKKNVFFLNPLQGISLQDGEIQSIDSEALQKTREVFFLKIEETLFDLLRGYELEIEELTKMAEAFLKEEMEGEFLEKIRGIHLFSKKRAREMRSPFPFLEKSLEEAILSLNHTGLWGAVNRLGEGRKVNIYGTFHRCGGELFQQENAENCGKLKGLIQGIFPGKSEQELLCRDMLLKKVTDAYIHMFLSQRSLFYAKTRERLYTPSAWKNPQMYWGDRQGSYNQRVFKDIFTEMGKRGVLPFLEKREPSFFFWEELAQFLDIEE